LFLISIMIHNYAFHFCPISNLLLPIKKKILNVNCFCLKRKLHSYTKRPTHSVCFSRLFSDSVSCLHYNFSF
jgi:hypothetical protein